MTDKFHDFTCVTCADQGNLFRKVRSGTEHMSQLPKVFTSVHGEKPMVMPDTMAFKNMRRRIREQTERVAQLDPGSLEHRIAANVLMLLQDSTFVLVESYAMLERVKISRGHDNKD